MEVLGLHCSAEASLVSAPGLSCPGACGILVPQLRDQTHVPCIGRQILNHWITREVLTLIPFLLDE